MLTNSQFDEFRIGQYTTLGRTLRSHLSPQVTIPNWFSHGPIFNRSDTFIGTWSRMEVVCVCVGGAATLLVSWGQKSWEVQFGFVPCWLCITLFPPPWNGRGTCACWGSGFKGQRCYSPRKKVRTYGTGMSAHTAPIVGLYVASAMPRMKPPPTHVAASERNAHDERVNSPDHPQSFTPHESRDVTLIPTSPQERPSVGLPSAAAGAFHLILVFRYFIDK